MWWYMCVYVCVHQTHSTPVPEASGKRESPLQSPDVCRRDDLNSCSSPDTEDAPDTVRVTHTHLHTHTSHLLLHRNPILILKINLWKYMFSITENLLKAELQVELQQQFEYFYLFLNLTKFTFCTFFYLGVYCF